MGKKIKQTCSQFCRPHCQIIGTVPIAPLEKQYKGKKVRKTNVRLKRFQLPLTLCWASTIHKCQGVALQKAYIDLSGVNWKSGMAYSIHRHFPSNVTDRFVFNFIWFKMHFNKTINYKTNWSSNGKEYQRFRAVEPFTLSTVSDIVFIKSLISSRYTHWLATYTVWRQRHFANSLYSAGRHTV